MNERVERHYYFDEAATARRYKAIAGYAFVSGLSLGIAIALIVWALRGGG